MYLAHQALALGGGSGGADSLANRGRPQADVSRPRPPGVPHPEKPAPVVLALHGAAMDGPMMVWFSGLNKKSDEAGFIVVYPSGTGIGLPHLECGQLRGAAVQHDLDDVAFIRRCSTTSVRW